MTPEEQVAQLRAELQRLRESKWRARFDALHARARARIKQLFSGCGCPDCRGELW